MSKFAASSSPNLARRQHAIYGLYLPSVPDVILYVGSWRVATLHERLWQHRAGECRTTTKMAAKHGVDTTVLQMRVLVYWMSGAEPSPEGKIMLALQARGQCRWNHPYAMSTKDCQQGAYRMHGTWGKTPEAHEIWVRIGRIGGYKGNREGKARGGRIGGQKGNREGKGRSGRINGPINLGNWIRTPEGHAHCIRAGLIGSRKAREAGAGRIGNCTHWHSDRPKVDRLCAECAAKRSNG